MSRELMSQSFTKHTPLFTMNPTEEASVCQALL